MISNYRAAITRPNKNPPDHSIKDSQNDTNYTLYVNNRTLHVDHKILLINGVISISSIKD